jgi:hypothetical protein
MILLIKVTWVVPPRPGQSNLNCKLTRYLVTSPSVRASRQLYSPATDSWIELSQVAGVIDGEIVVQVRDRTYKGTIQWTSG